MARIASNTITEALLLMGGGIIGAGVALLLAPQSGRKTRKEIVRAGKALESKGEKAVRDVASTVGAFATAVEGKAADILQRGKELTAEGKRRVLTVIEKGEGIREGRKQRLARANG